MGMEVMTVALGVPDHISRGLQSGMLERIGGVVRNADNKQVVTWLREAPHLKHSSLVMNPLFPGLNIGMLNFSISTMTFTIVMQRLQSIESRLKQIQIALASIENKIDLSFYANFRASIDLVCNASTMSNVENQKMSAMHAINRLLEAQHHYSSLTDDHLRLWSPATGEYLTTLLLAYIAEARCYLELDEPAKAKQRLIEGNKVTRPRVDDYVKGLLGPNPAVYLQPALKHTIDLRRMTRVYQWMDPTLDESAVFETLRDQMFLFDPKELSKFIWNPEVDIPKKKGFARLTSWLDDHSEAISTRLDNAMNDMEQVIESSYRFATYHTEIELIEQVGMDFHDWAALEPPSDANALQDAGYVMSIIPQEPITVSAMI